MDWRAGVVPAVWLLAGCASPGPVVEVRGALATTGAFRISGLQPAALSAVEKQVAEGLTAKGLRLATDAEPAAYTVQVTFADHLPVVGAFVPAETGDPAWRVMGQPRKPLSLRPPKGAYSLGVYVVDASSGREAYVARVSQTYRKPAPETDLSKLVAAALNPPSPAKP